jgi:hypothetical protein
MHTHVMEQLVMQVSCAHWHVLVPMMCAKAASTVAIMLQLLLVQTGTHQHGMLLLLLMLLMWLTCPDGPPIQPAAMCVLQPLPQLVCCCTCRLAPLLPEPQQAADDGGVCPLVRRAPHCCTLLEQVHCVRHPLSLHMW